MRLPEAEEAGIYRAAELFVDQALRAEGSLFTPGPAIWTAAGIDDFYARFNQQPDISGASFQDKLRQQLEGASAGTIQLAAEMLYVYFLLPQEPGGQKKRAQLETILSWSPTPVAVPSQLADVLDVGVVGTGVAYHTLRYDQLCYLVNFIRGWRRLEAQKVEGLLADPWEFKAFASSIDTGPAMAMREALHHLVFPDRFEPIVSVKHKKKFAEFFADLAPDIKDVDQRLLVIHEALAETHGSFASFYNPTIEALMGETPPSAGEPKDTPPVERRVWWVNQGSTYATERAGGYLWARQKNKAGNPEHHWTTMTRVQVGDVVVHYDKPNIRALSVVKAAAIDSDKPGEMADEPWAKDGWLVSVQIQDLPEAVPLSELPEAARPAGLGPFTVVGGVKQGYLWEVPSAMAAALAAHFGELWPTGVSKRPPTRPPATPGAGVVKSLHPIYKSIADQQFRFPSWLITDYLLSLGTKPFVLLSGISGTGKTKLAQLVAEYVAPPQQIVEAESNVLLSPDPDSFIHRVGKATLKHALITVPQHDTGLFPQSDSNQSIECRIEAEDFSGTGRFYPVGMGGPSNASISLHKGARDWVRDHAERGDTIVVTPLSDEPPVIRLRVVKARRHIVATASPQVAFISVRSDWTDNRSMLGYHNPLTGAYVPTELLRLLLHASAHPKQPHFAILDEMNLAKVEYYFSDFLSAMESGTEMVLHNAGEQVSAELGGEEMLVPERLRVPKNLLFTGTVNVDETTFMFSPKVLDRANVIQFHDVDLKGYVAAQNGPVGDGYTLSADADLVALLKVETARRDDYVGLDPALRKQLEAIHAILAAHRLHFGYRVANEIARYELLAERFLGERVRARAFDLQIQQKVLPKFAGNRSKLERPLWELLSYLTSGNATPAPLTVLELEAIDPAACAFPASAAALKHMLETLRQVGFASFIE